MKQRVCRRSTVGWCLTLVAIVLGAVGGESVQAALFEQGGLKITGDVRVRLEADFDSQNAAGVARDDRTRLRFRSRLALRYEANERLSFTLRLRSGSESSHQSPHITLVDFDDNDTGAADFNFDQWLMRWQTPSSAERRGWLTVGRGPLPFWRQNEHVWDDDVTVAGLAGGWRAERGGGRFELSGGYFSLPVGMRAFAGNLATLQLVYARGGTKVAGGLLSFDANPADGDAALLLNGNGLRDYTVWVASVQHKLAVGRGWTFGVDGITNSESYAVDTADPFTAANHDQTDGLVLSLQYGEVKEKGDWLVAYVHARIEALAVNASYAQDDWVRWGTANETRASNLEGHELRYVHGLGKSMNLVARLYVVEAITTVEDGNRFRLDFNVKF